MRNILPILFTFLLALIACKKNTTQSDTDNPYSNVSFCYTVVDDKTKQPIFGAQLNFWNGQYFHDQTYTDLNGRACVTILKKRSTEEKHITAGVYYETAIGNFPATNYTVNLKHCGFVRIHVQNIPPALPGDYIFINSQNSNAFSGDVVNTVYTSWHWTSIQQLNYQIYPNGNMDSTIYGSVPVSVNSYDTSDVYINY